MRHRVKTFKIGRTGAHRRAMMANMVCSLIEHGEIRTTVTKAKELRRHADKMVTLGKKGDLHHRRLAIAKIKDKDAVRKLFSEVAPRYSERNGGYTRIIRLGKRLGDAADMCIVQFVEETLTPKKKTKKAEETKAAPVKEEAPAEEPKAEEQVEETKAEEKKAEEAPAAEEEKAEAKADA